MPILDDSPVLQIASDTNYDPESDAYDGTPVIVAPSLGMLKQGLRPARQLAAQHRNYIDRQVALMIAALHADDAAIREEFADADEITAERLDNLIDVGWEEGWPKLAPGNSVRDHVEWQSFAWSDVTLKALDDGTWIEGCVGDSTMGSIQALGQSAYIYVPIKKVRNGAKLTKVRVHLKVNPAHASLPANLPNAEILRVAGGVAVATSLGSPQAAAPADVADWNAPGVSESAYFEWVPSAPGGEVMSDQQAYWLKLRDEHGANSLGGNIYYGMYLFWEISEVQP